MMGDLERCATIFKSVDWVIPAYLMLGGIQNLAHAIESAEPQHKQKTLEFALSSVYDEKYLSSMLLGLYGNFLFVKDFRNQISEGIEASFSGLYRVAVAAMIPVLEGVIRKIANAGHRDIGRGTQGIIAELDHILEKEKNSQHKFEERVIMFRTLRDFFNDKLLKNTDSYSGLDEFNRHGILHGIFNSYGIRINFLRSITLLDLLCYIVGFLNGGSAFAPNDTPDSLKLADYYRSLREVSVRAAHFRADQLFQ